MSDAPEAMPPAELSTPQQRQALRRYLWIDQGLVAFLVTVAINAVIAWFSVRRMDVVPLWGDPGIASDVQGTCLILPLVANFIVTKLTLPRVRGGNLPRTTRPPYWATGFLFHMGWRGLILSLNCWLFFAVPAVWLLSRMVPGGMTQFEFLVFKSLFAGGLAAIVCPLAATLALGDLALGDQAARPRRQ